MKKKTGLLFFSCLFCAALQAQTNKTLQANLWYCVGDWENHKHVMMTNNNHSKYDSEVKFLKSGKLLRISADEKKADSSYVYTIRKGFIKIDKTAANTSDAEKIFYYKLNTLEYAKTYELIPSTEAAAQAAEKE